MTKKALITGVTGQDGSYLAEFLLEKGYVVHGIKRRASSFNTERIDHIYQDPHGPDPQLKLHYGDLTDTSNLTRIISEVRPDEVYNLGAQSHVAVSFESPEYTADVYAIGTLRLLEAIRFLGLEQKTRFYQASTSELFGQVQDTPQKETTPFHPRSPYAVAKMYAYWIAVNYREAYGRYACNGILFNHESPRRGETFVTRKITRGLANIAHGLEQCLYMGNIDSLRDWGSAKDYVRMQWMMLQQDQPEDFVIATGVQYSVREYITWSVRELGLELEFIGEGVEEIATVTAVTSDMAPAVKPGDVVMRIHIDPRAIVGDRRRCRAVVHEVARAQELRRGGDVGVEHHLDHCPADLLDDPNADLAAVRGGEEHEGQDVRRTRHRETRAQISERRRAGGIVLHQLPVRMGAALEADADAVHHGRQRQGRGQRCRRAAHPSRRSGRRRCRARWWWQWSRIA
tara:strand:- start:3384 stop:4754 length:1371 start_codon:yes stop_codon:yes gene_type:complete